MNPKSVFAAPIDGLDAFAPAQRLTTVTQTRLTEAESAELDEFVEWCKHHGVNTSRSAAVRTFVLTGLRAFRAEEEGSG